MENDILKQAARSIHTGQRQKKSINLKMKLLMYFIRVIRYMAVVKLELTFEEKESIHHDAGYQEL